MRLSYIAVILLLVATLSTVIFLNENQSRPVVTTPTPTPIITATPIPSVCTMKGLTGPAQQENMFFCSTNAMNGVVTNGASSVYKAAIDAALVRHIIVGTPTSVIACQNWVNVPETCVTFTSGYRAEHYNPSYGHIRIYDPYNKLVWSE